MTHTLPSARRTLSTLVLSASSLWLVSLASAQNLPQTAPVPTAVPQAAVPQTLNVAPQGALPGGALPGSALPGSTLPETPPPVAGANGVVAEPNPFAPAPNTPSSAPVNGVPGYTSPMSAYPTNNATMPGAVGGDIYAPGGPSTVAAPVSAPPAGSPTALPPLPPPTVTGQVNTVVDDYLGMTPDQIRALRRTIDARQQAAAEMPNPPKAVTGSVAVSLAPGSVPPVIRTSQGSVSSFVVVDATGAAWPVENFQVGSPLFKMTRLDQGQGSTFAIETMGMYGQSNIILKLAAVPTPVSITLLAGQKEMDSRVELRVQGRGPNANIVAGSLPQGGDSRLLSVLDGVPPEGGRRLRVSGLQQVDAWMMPDQTLVVRSPVRIVKPATTQFVSSSDGTYVYTFRATPLLLGIANGQFVNIGISGW